MFAAINAPLVKRQVRRANVLLFAALAIYSVGFVLVLQQPGGGEDPLLSSVSLGTLLVGLLLWTVSQYYVRRYGPRQRLDVPLTQALKGLNDRYTLVHFGAERLPDHLLLGPRGVRVLVPRAIGGTVRCRRDHWTRLGSSWLLTLLTGSSLRNPSGDAARGVAQVREFLTRRAPDLAAAVPVSAVIVFTNPDVRLEIDGCQFPVTRARDLRAQIQQDRDAHKEQGGRSLAESAGLRALFVPPEAVAATTVADPPSRRTRQRPARRRR